MVSSSRTRWDFCERRPVAPSIEYVVIVIREAEGDVDEDVNLEILQ